MPSSVLNFLQKVEGIARFPVHLIDKGKNRNVPHCADLKQLSRLVFNTFRRINYHDRRIRRHQRAVGVL